MYADKILSLLELDRSKKIKPKIVINSELSISGRRIFNVILHINNLNYPIFTLYRNILPGNCSVECLCNFGYNTFKVHLLLQKLKIEKIPPELYYYCFRYLLNYMLKSYSSSAFVFTDSNRRIAPYKLYSFMNEDFFPKEEGFNISTFRTADKDFFIKHILYIRQ